MKQNTVFIIILAAGHGTRLNHKEKKQFIKIDKYPILILTLKTFLNLNINKEIILAVAPNDTEKCKRIITEYIKKTNNISIVKGGSTRNYSVYNSLKIIKNKTNKKSPVLIHDAARPLVNINDINKIINSLYQYPAITLGYKLNDTIKQINQNNIIINNPNRENYRGILTPQGFHFYVIWKAYQLYIKNPYKTNDDTQLVHNIGYNVKIIDGEQSNIKITKPYDLFLAKILYEKLYPQKRP